MDDGRSPHQNRSFLSRLDQDEEGGGEEEEEEEIYLVLNLSNHAAVLAIFASGMRSTFCIISQLLHAGIIIIVVVVIR